MKNVLRLMVVVLLVALVLPLVPVSAQDGGEGGAALAPEMVAVYLQPATAGSLTDNGDGTYALALQGVAPEITWIMSSPALAIQQQSSVNLAKQWAAATDLVADAVLQVGDLNIVLTVTAPAYDEAAQSQTYVATVVEIVAPEGVKEPDLPTSFDVANLSIAWTVDFQAGLVTGIEAMYEGMRVPGSPECLKAQSDWSAYQAWDIQKSNEQEIAMQTCYGWDGTTDAAKKTAACTLMNSILAERRAKAKQMASTSTYLNTQCK
jgi:hypothetical protein